MRKREGHTTELLGVPTVVNRTRHRPGDYPQDKEPRPHHIDLHFIRFKRKKNHILTLILHSVQGLLEN